MRDKGLMSLHEIARHDWPGALERFSREHRGWLATVHGKAATTALEQPLRAVAAESDAVVIRLGDEVALRIEAPIAVRVDENGLDVEAAEGVTRLRFRRTAPPEALDGIAATEH